MGMPSKSTLKSLAARALDVARRNGLTIVTAESCTAGQLAAQLSEAPGAADVLHGGFVTYTKENKTKALDVPEALLRKHGAVCAPVARAMAEGALLRSPATLSVAITGVAGPAPDEDGNPVGRVCFGVARSGKPTESFEMEYGDLGRAQILTKAVADALHILIRKAQM
jgi:nicotinamide-nucleotide amidase